MRPLCVLAYFLALSLPALAQVPPAGQSYDFDQYTKAVAHYGSNATGFRTTIENNLQSYLRLAAMDPTLLRSPATRSITLIILSKVDNLNSAVKRAHEETAALQTKMNAPSSAVSSSSPSRNRPPKDKRFEAMNQQSQIMFELSKVQAATKEAVETQVAQLKTLADTPEGQKFAVPETSAFLVAIISDGQPPGFVPRRPSSQPSPPATSAGTPVGMPPGQSFSSTIDPGNMPRISGPPLPLPPSFSYFEVATATPEGFFGYATKLDVTTEQVGDLPAGSPKEDADGNYLHIADRSKNVFIRGYTQPAALGDIIRIRVAYNGKKVIESVQAEEYLYSPE